jgi:hypothetical protein
MEVLCTRLILSQRAAANWWYGKRCGRPPVAPGIVFNPAAGAREGGKRLDYSEKGLAQLPAHYAVQFYNISTLERVEVLDSPAVGLAYILDRSIRFDAHRGIVVATGGDGVKNSVYLSADLVKPPPGNGIYTRLSHANAASPRVTSLI